VNDKKAAPVLTDQRTGTKLALPSVENVGSMRQVAPPEPVRLSGLMVDTN